MLSKKIIFLTGATGTMGEEGLKQILSRSDRFNLRVLVRPSAKNKAFMSRYEHDAALEIVWGGPLLLRRYPALCDRRGLCVACGGVRFSRSR